MDKYISLQPQIGFSKSPTFTFISISHFHFPGQVNGVDVSQCSHEEAVQRFLEAEEPIMVEVKRRGKAAETTEAKVMRIQWTGKKVKSKGKTKPK